MIYFNFSREVDSILVREDVSACSCNEAINKTLLGYVLNRLAFPDV